MKPIVVGLTIFLVVLIIVIFIFSFFVSWTVASLKIKIEKLEKDLNGLGRETREHRARLNRDFAQHQIKFNDLVNSLEMPSQLKDNNINKDYLK